MDAYSIGQMLRQARDERELTLEDVKAKTRIAVTILDAFEQGNFQVSDLSPVQVRGMLSNYASFLGLEPDTILAYYEESLVAASRRRRRSNVTASAAQRRQQQQTAMDARRSAMDARVPSEVRRPQTDPRRPAGDPTNSQRPETFAARREKRTRRGRGILNLLVIITLTVASLAVIAAIVVQLLERNPDPSIAPGVDVQGNGLAQLPPTFTFTPPPSPTTIRTPTLPPRSAQNYQGEPVLVTVDFLQRAWVRMVVDGAELYAGIVRPGELTLEYRAVNEIILSTSNAEALAVTYNGQQQGTYGGRGQAVEIIYRPNGNITVETGQSIPPTSEFSPTPQPTSNQLVATLLAEGTPTATDGPSPTPTETFTASPTPEFSPTMTLTPTETETPTVTATITASATFTETPTPTETLTPTPTPTPSAIVPPRVTPVNSTPAKTP